MSGAQKWNGTADTLKPNPTIMNSTAMMKAGSSTNPAETAATPAKLSSPVSPYRKDIPYSSRAVANTPSKKYFSDASLDSRSPFRQPASKYIGPDTSSMAMNSVIRSREEASTTDPRIDSSSRK